MLLLSDSQAFNNIMETRENMTYFIIFLRWSISEVPNSTNAIPIEKIVSHLKISKKNKSAYERTLNCAYDPRPSSLAIGGVGVALLGSFVALIIIADCEAIYRNK